MPFITDYLFFNKLSNKKYLLQESWPKVNKFKRNQVAINNINKIISLVTKIRNVKSNLKIEPKSITNLYSEKNIFNYNKKNNLVNNINYLAKIRLMEYEKLNKKETNLFRFVFEGNNFYIEKINAVSTGSHLKKDVKLVKGELKKIEIEILRLNSKLKNKNFLSKAPINVVKDTKLKLEKSLKLKEKIILKN